MPRRDRTHLRPVFQPLPHDDAPVRCASGLVVEVDAGRATWRRSVVALSAREASLLALLVRHPGRLIAHDELGLHAWGNAAAHRDSVTATVKRVRARLRTLGFSDAALATVPALGYRWDSQVVTRGDEHLDAAG